MAAMGDAGIVVIIVLVIAVAIVIRLVAGGMDHDRVRQYVESRGGRVIDAYWAPFGKGWFGEKNDRIYGVRFVDADGNEHEASVKTSLFSGVYFSEDRIVRRADRGGDDAEASAGDERAEALEAENRRLREELERLKGREA